MTESKSTSEDKTAPVNGEQAGPKSTGEPKSVSASDKAVESKNSQVKSKYRTGLRIGGISVIITLLLLFSGSLKNFDTYLTTLIFQNGFEKPNSKNNILIVKKDQATSELLQKNPGRSEFASLFRLLGKYQKTKYPGRDGLTPVLSFEVGHFEKQKKYLISTSFSSWCNDTDEIDKYKKEHSEFEGYSGFIKIRENIWGKNGSTRDHPFKGNPLKNLSNVNKPLLLPTIFTDWTDNGKDSVDLDSVVKTKGPDKPENEGFSKNDLLSRWTNVFFNLISSRITAKLKMFPAEKSLFKFTIYLRKKSPIKEYYVKPAAVIGFDFVLQGEKTKKDDAALVQAIKNCDCNVVLAQHTKKEEVFLITQKEHLLASKTVPVVAGKNKKSSEKGAITLDGSKVDTVTRKILPHKKFITSNVNLAMIDMSVGNKSFVTEVPLFVPDETAKKLEPSFSLMTSMIYLDYKNNTINAPDGYVNSMYKKLDEIYPYYVKDEFRGPLKIKDISVPVDRNGRMLMDYVGSTKKGRMKQAAFSSASFYECFDDEKLKELLSTKQITKKARTLLRPKKAHFRTLAYSNNKGGKICLIGPFEITDFDYFPTPLSDRTPLAVQTQPLMGIEIHANAIVNILEGKALRHPRVWKTAVLLIVFTLILGALLDLTSPFIGALIALWFIYASVWFGDYSYHKLREVFWFGALLISFSFTWIMSTLINYVRQRSRAAATKQMFSKFVAADVVQYMLEHPELVQPGGEKVELTIFFSDVAGFTSISEALTPEQLVVLLNEYLGAMTDLLFEYGGTLDKFIGDAVMAFWNHPKKQEDHALRACLCALAMQEKITELQVDWAKRGLPRVAARAGLNSAQVVVGYMGSEKAQMNFTCMGDGVNLASRLEGANKEYGTLMMVSDATYQQVKHRITGRFLDFLAVKGKKKPVKVFELVSEKGKEPPGWDELIEMYDKAIKLHLDRKWEQAIETFENLLAKWPDDGPSKTYIKRCLEYMENPPPENWDGRYILTHK